MPSGSRGGGHSGGGGRSGGGHSSGGWGGGRSGGGHRTPRSYGYRNGHRVVFLHGSSGEYMRTSHNAFLVFLRVLMFIAIFFCFAMGTSYSASNQFIDGIKKDYNHYQQMIDNAKSKEQQGYNYIISADVTGVYTEYDSSGKWYIEYTFKSQNGSLIEGYTFDTYTKERAQEIQSISTIEIAVDRNPITIFTDSIDVEYETTTLEDDGQYLYHIKKLNGYKVGSICSIVLLIACVVLMPILTIKFTKDDSAESVQQALDPANQVASGTQTATTTQTVVSQKRYCAYCNSKLKDGEYTCSRCGATVKKGTDK